MKSIEFYTFNSEVRCRKSDGADSKLTEGVDEIISYLLEKIEEFYPGAYNRLCQELKERLPNTRFFRFGIVERFARCNFGNIDNVSDVTNCGRLNLELVACPLRGICKDENVICNPTFNSQISAAEMRVLELIFKGREYSEIASKLYLSEHTCRNHVRNAYTRLGFHEKAQFIDYAHRNKLFKED